MSISSKTYTPKAADIQRNWRVIDAADRPLGRLASEVAQILRGKDKPIFTPNLDTGDFVIVVNAAKIHVSRKKLQKKKYYSHSGYPGGFKTMSLEQMLLRHPRRVIEYAVWGMLPKGPLGRTLLRKLKVYAEETHPHGAQALEHARPETPGKPGRKPPKKIKAQRAEPELSAAAEPVAVAGPEAEAVSETVAEPEAPAREEAETPARPRTRRAKKSETAEPVAEQAAEPVENASPDAGEAPEASEAPKEAAEAAEPLTPPPARPRSRRVRAQQAQGARPEQESEAEEQDEQTEQPPEKQGE